jgi:hypothetical protein
MIMSPQPSWFVASPCTEGKLSVQNPIRAILISAVAAATLMGCEQTEQLSKRVVGGTTTQIRDVRPTTGFLPKPELLSPGASGEAVFVYRNPNVRLASYGKVLLDPVIIRVASDSPLMSAPADERQELAASFYSDLYKALAKRCEMVREPSAGTLRVKIALVAVETPNATLNTVATYAPYVSTASSLASLAFNKGVGLFAGTATVEGFATDAKTGKLLWQAVDKQGGTNAMIKNTVDSWVDVNNAFDTWSDKLASKMEQLGICGK